MTQWLLTLLSRRPHFYIGGQANPYLLRWYLIPRNPWLNVYLHKFLRDDDDRALHDHPWWFVSILICGSYREILRDDLSEFVDRYAPSVAYRPATHRHCVCLEWTVKRDENGNFLLIYKPCWTIIITGPKVREWGFWCPKGFVPWYEFVDSTDNGNIGKGCD